MDEEGVYVYLGSDVFDAKRISVKIKEAPMLKKVLQRVSWSIWRLDASRIKATLGKASRFVNGKITKNKTTPRPPQER